jgi:hypothetical protein
MEQDDRIVGYQRALKGTCGACSGSRSYEAFSPNAPVVELKVHPNCQCVAEPVVTPSKPRDAYGRMNLTKREDFLRMQQYVGTKQSFWVNERLRYPEVARPGNQPPEFVDRIIRELDDIMGRVASSEKPIQVWRGIVGKPDELGIKAGNVVTDAGYGSTSALRTQVERFMDARIEKYGTDKGLPIIMDLTVDPRVKAVWGANVSESELVLQRGVRYLVESVKREGDRWRVKAKILPPK